MTKCKLITPVLLQLDRPMLSPVKETEFVIQGVKEYSGARMDVFLLGVLTGMFGAILLGAIFVVIERWS